MRGSVSSIPVTIRVRNENQTAFAPVLKLTLRVVNGSDLQEAVTLPDLVGTQQIQPCASYRATTSEYEKCQLVGKLRKNMEVK